MIRRICESWRLPLAALCQVLALQSALAVPLAGQQGMRIVVLEGEGAKNVTQQISSKPLTVSVQDSNNRSVSGASVMFVAPENGPSGDFANDSRIIRVTTNAEGIANAGPYHPNAIEGPYEIQVRVEYRGATAMAVISQMNIAQGRGHKKLIAVLAIAGAAAAATVAAKGKSSSSTSNSPTITFGGAAVGAPK